MSKQYEYQRRYRQTENGRKHRHEENKAYYDRLSLPPSEWTDAQNVLVLKHEYSDKELSRIIGHGVRAIQIQRARLKKPTYPKRMCCICECMIPREECVGIAGESYVYNYICKQCLEKWKVDR